MSALTRFIPASPLVLLSTVPAVLALPFLFSLTGWQPLADAFSLPGYWKSVAVALLSASLGTLLATVLATALLARALSSKSSWLTWVMPPLLATPHAAMAVGLAFLFAPSGWLLRLVSPWATGLERPPTFSVLQDDWGLFLAFGLALKELPFIVLLSLSAGRREKLEPGFRLARSLGYPPRTAFLKVMAPQLLKSMTLPITIAFIYGLSAVDMGSVLGPTTPPPLSVMALGKLSDPDPTIWRQGIALSLHLAVLTLLSLAAFSLLLNLLRPVARRWASNGVRHSAPGKGLGVMAPVAVFVFAASVLSFVGLLLWSFAKRWRFPDTLPSTWVEASWIWERGVLSMQSLNTLWLALVSALMGLLLAFLFLLAERRFRRPPGSRYIWTSLAIVPLLVPQMTLVPALLLLDLKFFGLSPWLLALWGHVMFTAAYSYLTLSGPVLSLDARYRRTGLALGQNRFQTLWKIELPLLFRPIMASLAIGLSVSVASYLPTLTLGQGRIETFTIEAVAAATGGSRRTAAQFALAQTFWALLFFFGALALPNLVFRNRQGMKSHVA